MHTAGIIVVVRRGTLFPSIFSFPLTCTCSPRSPPSLHQTFQGCETVKISPPYTFYYTLTPNGTGTTWRGGLKVNANAVQGGWAGFGWGLAMIGSDSVIVSKCSNCTSGAAVNGYRLTDYNEDTKVPGSFPIYDADAAVASDGSLVAMFTANLPASSPEKLTSGPFYYITAIGPVGPDDSIKSHAVGKLPYGSQTTTLKSAPVAAANTSTTTHVGGASPPPLPAPTPPPTVMESEGAQGESDDTSAVVSSPPLPPPSSPPPVPAAAALVAATNTSAPTPTTPAGTPSSTECALSIGSPGTLHSFSACKTLGGYLDVHWQTPPTTDANGNITMNFGIQSTVPDGQYISLGFPSTPGVMVGGTAMVLTPCAVTSCPTGAALKDYYLGGETPATVTQPGHLAFSNVNAAAGAGGTAAAGVFTVSLPASALQSNQQLPVIFARGPMSTTGDLREHTSKASTSLDVSQTSSSTLAGTPGASPDPSTEDTSNDVNQEEENAHAWLMTIGWTLILMGAVIARSFRNYSRSWWFQVHRAVQVTGLVLVLVAFIIIFVSLDGAKSDYDLHFNLGVAAFVLGMVQLHALFFRPALDSTWRRPWALCHHWIGRSAVLVAVANIYEGIKIQGIGPWAVISYSIVFGCIVGVGAFKEGFDYLSLPPPKLVQKEFANEDIEREALRAAGGGQHLRPRGAGASAGERRAEDSAATSVAGGDVV